MLTLVLSDSQVNVWSAMEHGGRPAGKPEQAGFMVLPVQGSAELRGGLPI